MDQNRPLVSVIIPTFNRAGFIKKAVQSVLDQTVKDIQIVVADDGSSDDTRERVESFKDPRILYHWFPHKGFPAYPRNRGIELAAGEYIAFLDSDDTWLSNHLELCRKALSDNGKADGVFTDFYKIYDNDILIPQKATKGKRSSSTLKDMVSNFSSIGAASNVVVRKRVFDAVGSFNEDEDMAGSEDWQMWVRIARKFAFTIVPAGTVIYRVHGGNLTLNPEKIERSTKAALDSIFSHPDISPIVRPYYRKAYAEVNTLAAINYYAAGDMALARNRLARALHFRPLHICDSRFLWTFLRISAGKRISCSARRLKQYFQNQQAR